MPHPTKRLRLHAIILGFLTLGFLIALLAAPLVQADLARDDGGKVIDLSKWREIAAGDTLFTTPLHAPGPIETIKTQTRDNVIHHEHIFFTEKKGRIFFQHVINAFFSNSVKNKVRDKDVFLRKLQSVPKEMQVSYTDPIEINHSRYPSGGYYSILTFAGSKRTCFIADGGYKMNQTIYDNDMGEYDTIMSMNYCDDKLNIDKLVNLVRKLEIIGKRPEDRKKYIDQISKLKRSGAQSAKSQPSTSILNTDPRKYNSKNWKEVEVSEASFNVPTISAIPISTMKRRVVNRVILSEEYNFKDGVYGNKLVVHHFLNGAFSPNSITLTDSNAFTKSMKKFIGSRFLSADKPTAISPQDGTSGGYYAHLTRSHANSYKCLYSEVGLQLTPQPTAQKDMYDTIISYRYCNKTKPSIENMQRILASLEYVGKTQ